MSVSEESTHSSTESLKSIELSLTAEYDEIIRLTKLQRRDSIEDAFINFAEQTKELAKRYEIAVGECRRLQAQLDLKIIESSDLESKLKNARKMIDSEKRLSRKIEDERDRLEDQIAMLKEFLNRDIKLTDDARQKLSFLNNNRESVPSWDPNVVIGQVNGQPQLSMIQEINTTGSLLSDFSYSRSEDDMDVSIQHGKTWKKHRPSTGGVPEPATKKRRSSMNKVVEIANTDSIRTTTTVNVPKYGPITATSVIESIPAADAQYKDLIDASKKPENDQHFGLGKQWCSPRDQQAVNKVRQHSLQTKTIVMPDTCGPCEKRIRFGKTALKCKDCRTTCHPECRDNLPLPCIPHVNTPQKNNIGFISDYTPTTSPMVPALIIHCLNEIELRGLEEIGIYRIPGSEKDVKQLKEKFLRGKGTPCISQTDVHVICGTVKDFLRNLQEPLITYRLWSDFVKCVELPDNSISAALYDVISGLPQPNRDTLAYMILHLKKVGESKECKMPISNLSKIFGPTIVGYSSADPETNKLLQETRQQNMVMECLMNLPAEYWSAFIKNLDSIQQTPKLQQTPSTDSLLTGKINVTPTTFRSTWRKQGRFFPTPPAYKY